MVGQTRPKPTGDKGIDIFFPQPDLEILPKIVDTSFEAVGVEVGYNFLLVQTCTFRDDLWSRDGGRGTPTDVREPTCLSQWERSGRTNQLEKCR